MMLAIVTHWTANDTAHDAVGDNHGVLFSGAGYADGQIGRAFRFDGLNDGVVVADDPSLALTQSLSIEGWVRADSLPPQGTHGHILFRGDDRGGLDPYSLRVEDNGAVRFQVTGLSPTNGKVTAPMPLGEFVHVAGTLDDATGTMSLYLNGVLMSQATTAVRPIGALDPASNPSIGIGNHGGYPESPHNYPFHGLIDELRIHDTALSEAEVLASYNTGRGSLQPSLSVEDAFVTEGTQTSFLVDDLVASQSGGLVDPRGITFGPGGDLFVTSTQPAQVLRFDGSTGAPLGSYDASNAGQDSRTWDVVLHNGYLFATTAKNGSVLRFDAQTGLPAPATGKPGATFVSPGDGGLGSAFGLDVGGDGHLYLASQATNSVLRYDGNTGAFLGVYVPSSSGGLDSPTSLAFGPDGNLYVGSNNTDEVLRYQGPSGNSPGAPMGAFVSAGSGGLEATAPGGLAFSPSGDLYVSSNANHVLRYDGATGDFVESIATALPGTLIVPRGLAFDGDGTLHVASGRTDAVLREEESSDAIVPVMLSAPSPTTVTVQVNTVDGSAVVGSDYVTTNETITFAPGDTSQLLRVPITNDSAPEQAEDFAISLSDASAGATIQDNHGSVTISDDDFIELFSDSFEVGSNSNDWNGAWLEDGQNDWFRSTQRATVGNYSAEVDGKATDATLTMTNPVDLTPYASATVSFSWHIEGSFDGGEYLKFEVWNGTNWTEMASLYGNVDQENVWHHELIEIDGAYFASNFQLRFRAKANRSNEDANVDEVRLVATSLAGSPNQAPSITSSEVTTATEDLHYSYDVDASDPDAGDTLTFSLDAFPSGMTIDTNTGLIQWTPSNAQVGSNAVTVRAQDAGGLFDTQSFSITVVNTNDAPTITSTAVTAATVESLYRYDVDASDPDVGDSLTYSLLASPAGMSINSTTGVISWTPDAGQVGTHPVTVRVKDNGGLKDEQAFSISVTAAAFTKFYVVDTSADDTFEYDAAGNLEESYNLGSGNNAPRGVAADAAGDTLWVIDNDDYVYVYDTAGALLRSWKATGLSRPEGIATDGEDLWIVDRGNDRVHFFDGGAAQTTNAGATSSFALAAGNPRGITTDGTHLWVVDTGTDDVYKYTVGGTLVGSWALDGSNTVPRGITIDPGNVADIWVVDSTDDAVYQYTGAATRTTGSQTASVVFSLAAGNTNPQGIADPPPVLASSANGGRAPHGEPTEAITWTIERFTTHFHDNRTSSVETKALEIPSTGRILVDQSRLCASSEVRNHTRHGVGQTGSEVESLVDRVLVDLIEEHLLSKQLIEELLRAGPCVEG